MPFVCFYRHNAAVRTTVTGAKIAGNKLKTFDGFVREYALPSQVEKKPGSEAVDEE
jgi:hypothetical protein